LGNIHPGKNGLGNPVLFQGIELFENLICPQAPAFSTRKTYPAIGATAVTAVLDFKKSPGMGKEFFRNKAESVIGAGLFISVRIKPGSNQAAQRVLVFASGGAGEETAQIKKAILCLTRNNKKPA